MTTWIWRMPGAIMAAALLVPALSAAADDDGAQTLRLHVGATGLRCVQAPCPGRGVYEPGQAALTTRDNLFYVDLTGEAPPPPMIGASADQTEIVRAWSQRACLAVDGRLVSGGDGRPVLHVARVIGPCR